jgi:hypothetical protein
VAATIIHHGRIPDPVMAPVVMPKVKKTKAGFWTQAGRKARTALEGVSVLRCFGESVRGRDEKPGARTPVLAF